MTRRPRLPLAIGLCIAFFLAGLIFAARGTGADSGADGRITAAEVKAFAAAVNLQLGDLPGADGDETIQSGGYTAAQDRRLAKCLRVSPWKPRVARVTSDAFSRSSTELTYSAVEAFPTPGENEDVFALLTGRKGIPCYRKLLLEELDRFEQPGSGISILKPRLSRLKFLLPGRPPVFATRVRYVLDLEGIGRSVIYADSISVLPKNISFELALTKEKGGAPSRSKEERLLSLLYERALAAEP